MESEVSEEFLDYFTGVCWFAQSAFMLLFGLPKPAPLTTPNSWRKLLPWMRLLSFLGVCFVAGLVGPV